MKPLTKEEKQKLYPDTKAPIYWDTEHIETVGTLAGRGMRHIDIAHYFGITKTRFYEYVRENEALERALMQGKSKMISFVAGQLLNSINDGNVSSIQFYLKMKGGYHLETDIVNGVVINSDTDDEIFTTKEPEKLSLDTDDPNEAARKYQEIMLRKN